MCGIAGFIVKKELEHGTKERLLDALLHGIANRGGDATGFVARSLDGTTEWEKAACDVRPFIDERHPLPAGTEVVLAHTRFATQGTPGFARNNHPLRRGPFYLVHNGVITNEDRLYRLAAREPYGVVDSEALAAVIAAAGSLEHSLSLLEETRGSAAIAVLDERDGSAMLARLSSSPLYVLETRRLVLFASTAFAVEQAHRLVVGSLGRAKATGMLEGDALVWRGGKLRKHAFQPLPWNEYTPSWMSGMYDRYDEKEKATTSVTTAPDDEQEQVPDEEEKGYDEQRWGSYASHCEICNHPLHDSYDLYDEGDRYEVCEVCFDAFADETGSGKVSSTVNWSKA